MICATDVNGWESDTIPAVVEHRTGVSSAPLPHEADLYAVSAGAALQQMRRNSDGVAVHFRAAAAPVPDETAVVELQRNG
jgi:hypothetical protein